MLRLGIVGTGRMTATLLSALAANLPVRLDHLALLGGPRSQGAEAMLERHGAAIARETSFHADRASFLGVKPTLAAECAGHAAVLQHGPDILASGCDLIVVSVGSLSDDALLDRLQAAARQGKAKLIVTAGAAGGLDVLGAARISGLHKVVYRGIKPPAAWRGTPAETILALDELKEKTVFYQGTARQAASAFPQNANVAAAVALAGAGFDLTLVQLIADPTIERNIHEIAVQSACADFTIQLEGRPSPDNPKTSLTAGYNVARNIINHINPMIV